jgi:hypothetical protein
LDGMRNADTTRKSSEPELAQIGNVKAVSMAALSEAKLISKPEFGWLYVSGNEKCLMTVEIVAPQDNEDELKLVRTVFTKSFEAAWAK